MGIPLIELFCTIDDFCKDFQPKWLTFLKANKLQYRYRPASLCLSEVMTLLVAFHQSGFRTFKDYYTKWVVTQWREEFPSLVSYNRFIELVGQSVIPLELLARHYRGTETGIYLIDSTPLPVCHVMRRHQHRVFRQTAQSGKTVTGWFFGFKLHLICNHIGEIMDFRITQGNVHDSCLLEPLSNGLEGKLLGDKGYISEASDWELAQRNLTLITKKRKNMAQQNSTDDEKLLKKRGTIESVIEQLKFLCHSWHTRHRSILNAFANLYAGIIAYALKPKKPSFALSA